MKRNYRNAYNALKTLGVPMFERDDRPERFFISAEHPESFDWCNYYSTRSDWVFGVNPAIETVLKRYGLFPEWENPGCLVVCEV